MADDFYPFVDSGDPAPDNSHITGIASPDIVAGEHAGGNEQPVHGAQADSKRREDENLAKGSPRATEEPRGESTPDDDQPENAVYATRIAVYDDMLSTPRVIVVKPNDPRSYLEEITNTVYRCMKEQGGSLSLMVVREVVENFIHAHFTEPIVSILDNGNTIRFADQGPGIEEKERAFEFGVTSANRSMKRYIRGTGAGLPMVQQYLENAGGVISIEDNLGTGTVVTVSVDAARAAEIRSHRARGAAVRGAAFPSEAIAAGAGSGEPSSTDHAPDFYTAPSANAGSGVGTTPEGTPFQNPYGSQYPAMPAANPSDMQHMVRADAPGQNNYPGYPYQQPTTNPAPAVEYPDQRTYQAPGFPHPSQQGEYPAWQPYQASQPPYLAQYGSYQGYPAPAGWQQPHQPYAPYGYQPADVPSNEAATPAQQPRYDYQQMEQKFSTNQQMQGLAAETASPIYPSTIPAHGTPMETYVSERGILALNFIAQHGQGGPTELAAAYGNSNPTWSRELATLGEQGFITKHGRKYFLTSLGSNWLAAHNAREQNR